MQRLLGKHLVVNNAKLLPRPCDDTVRWQSDNARALHDYLFDLRGEDAKEECAHGVIGYAMAISVDKVLPPPDGLPEAWHGRAGGEVGELHASREMDDCMSALIIVEEAAVKLLPVEGLVLDEAVSPFQHWLRQPIWTGNNSGLWHDIGL